jgi:hypothetical protein
MSVVVVFQLIPKAFDEGVGEGAAYLVPKPEPDHSQAVIKGLILMAYSNICVLR